MSKYDGEGEKLSVVTDLGIEEWEFPTYSPSDVVAVFDLDFIVYSSACMTDNVTIEAHRNGKKKVFSGRKEFNDMLKDFNERNPDRAMSKEDFEIVEVVKAQPISYALRSIKARVEGIMEQLGANKCELYVGGSNNFRDKLPLPVPYKGNRKEVRRPTHLSACKEYAVNVLGAKSVYGREADDVVTQRAIQIRKQGAEAILVGEDKDAYGTYNIFTFNPKKDFEPFFIGENPMSWSEGFLGEVYRVDGTRNYKGFGLRWKAFQICTFDAADGYNFLDIARMNLMRKEGLTSKQASNRIKFDLVSLVDQLNGAEDERALWEVVVAHAKSYYGEGPVEYITHTGQVNSLDFLGILNLYYHCVHMRLSINDDNTFYTVLRKQGLYDKPFDQSVELCYLDDVGKEVGVEKA